MLGQLLACAGDMFSELTGYAATRVPLARATAPNEVTLDLPGYGQLDSYSCGVVAGVMALKQFKPAASFSAFYARVDPHPVWGTSTAKLVRALRHHGLRVRERDDLGFASLCRAIDAGSPVLVCVHNPGTDCAHWVVVYGYGRRPSRMFLATNGLPFLDRNVVPFGEFTRLWCPPGNGLVCAAPRRRKGRQRRTRSATHSK